MKKDYETIEMRVHHLDMLGCYIKSGRSKEGIKEDLMQAEYNKEVTEEELDSFARSIYEFYKKVLSGKNRVKLTSKPDGICDGRCTLRKTGNCNLESVREMDAEKASINEYNVKIGKTYSLKEILQIIEDYFNINR